MLEKFNGNELSKEEKEYRIKQLFDEMINNEVDFEFIPYLMLINYYNFIMTTQCCTGHNEINKCAHIDFRCSFKSDFVIDKIIRPLSDKFSDIDIELITEGNKVRYILWLNNNIWKEQIMELLNILDNIDKNLNNYYEENIDDTIIDIIKYLRNNGINTECSCNGHKIEKPYIQCQLIIDGEIKRIFELVYNYLCEKNKEIEYDIKINIKVENGCVVKNSINIEFPISE